MRTVNAWRCCLLPRRQEKKELENGPSIRYLELRICKVMVNKQTLNRFGFMNGSDLDPVSELILMRMASHVRFCI